jgi:hypothetical protein
VRAYVPLQSEQTEHALDAEVLAIHEHAAFYGLQQRALRARIRALRCRHELAADRL